MHAFIDTTELFNNARLSGAKWEKLRRFLQKGDHIGCVTQMAIEELVNHVRERLEKVNRSLDSHNATVQSDLGKECGIAFVKIDVEKQVEEYRSDLMDRIKKLGLRVVKSDEVSLDKLVKRALARRKPFDDNGQKGFRDAIQWEAILDVLGRSDSKAVLITSNKKDFGSHGGLEKHLCDDLEAIGRSGMLTICEGFDAFVEQYVEPELDRLKEIELAIAEGEYKSLETMDLVLGLRPLIESAVERAVRSDGLRSLDAFARMNYSDPELESLDDDFQIIEVEVFRVDDGKLAITVAATVHGSVRCHYDPNGDPSEEPLYSEHVGDAEFTVHCGAIMSEESGETSDETVDHVDIYLGRNWERPDYGD